MADVDLVDGQCVDDHGEGHLDTGTVFDGAEFDRASFAVVGAIGSGVLIDFVALGEALVKEAEVFACERGRTAAGSCGVDVAADFHVGGSCGGTPPG